MTLRSTLVGVPQPEPDQLPDHGRVRRRVIAALGLGALGASGAGVWKVVFEPEVGAIDASSAASPSVRQPQTSARSLDPQADSSTEITTAASEPEQTDKPAELVDPDTSDVTTTTIDAEAESIDVVSRDGWGAAPSRAGLVEHTPVRLTLHHSAVEQVDLSVGPARVRQHQTHHQSLGWPDLAYHFVVDRAGVAYEGRAVQFRGDTGTEYDPDGHFLVCMEGNFDKQAPSPEQVETSVQLFAWATARFDIDPGTVAGHNAYAATSCPGKATDALLPELADRIGEAAPVLLSIATD